MSRHLAVLAALALALAACGEDEPLPPVPGDGGDGGGGAGGSGGGAGGTGGEGGTGGSGGAADPCDDPADTCTDGVCRFPAEEIDCAIAADNYVALCPDPACGLSIPGQPCADRATQIENCLAGKRNSPSDNVNWWCLATTTTCQDNALGLCILSTCAE